MCIYEAKEANLTGPYTSDVNSMTLQNTQNYGENKRISKRIERQSASQFQNIGTILYNTIMVTKFHYTFIKILSIYNKE